MVKYDSTSFQETETFCIASCVARSYSFFLWKSSRDHGPIKRTGEAFFHSRWHIKQNHSTSEKNRVAPFRLRLHPERGQGSFDSFRGPSWYQFLLRPLLHISPLFPLGFHISHLVDAHVLKLFLKM